MIPLFLASLVGYVLGSFPTAYLVTRWRRRVDIRTIGDQNMGAANVWHQVHPFAGIIVGLVDALKGALAVLTARFLDLPHGALIIPGIAAVIGHAWPFTLRFWGGAGAATSAGVFATLFPIETFLGGLIGGPLFFLTRRTNLAGGACFGLIPFLVWFGGHHLMVALSAMAVPGLMAVRVFQQERAKQSGPLPVLSFLFVRRT